LFIVCKGANFLACPCCEIDPFRDRNGIVYGKLEIVIGFHVQCLEKKSLYTKFCVGVEGLPI